MTGPVTLYAEFTARPGHEVDVESLVAGLTPRVRSEAGNTLFIVHHRSNDPAAYLIYEEYHDRAAFDAHITAAHTVAFNQALAEHILETRSQISWLRRHP